MKHIKLLKGEKGHEVSSCVCSDSYEIEGSQESQLNQLPLSLGRNPS